jgi:hypothetical protein
MALVGGQDRNALIINYFQVMTYPDQKIGSRMHTPNFAINRNISPASANPNNPSNLNITLFHRFAPLPLTQISFGGIPPRLRSSRLENRLRKVNFLF